MPILDIPRLAHKFSLPFPAIDRVRCPSGVGYDTGPASGSRSRSLSNVINPTPFLLSLQSNGMTLVIVTRHNSHCCLFYPPPPPPPLIPPLFRPHTNTMHNDRRRTLSRVAVVPVSPLYSVVSPFTLLPHLATPVPITTFYDCCKFVPDIYFACSALDVLTCHTHCCTRGSDK
ncbi:hypothetical protein BD311DRAFT_167604 [Dichomitus squalens]|uniref:Uncharacterized protein n=1 Tax=Dichomitus squalens TaxID=114155 RepID=A0A4Q9M7G5_9APHY|nr:hypothetical protein BD311DRAFT_167604 [Dichomitus squalens]